VRQFRWRKSVRSSSPMMANDGGARTESGEEEGVSGGGSQRGGRVGSGEEGELELGRGRGAA
jgi:hypothetical protein